MEGELTNGSPVRERVAHGDGKECERLIFLKPGHVLTVSDVLDIKNLITDHYGEILQTMDLVYETHQQALRDAAPDKLDLINKIHELECQLAAEKALRRMDRRNVTRMLIEQVNGGGSPN